MIFFHQSSTSSENLHPIDPPWIEFDTRDVEDEDVGMDVPAPVESLQTILRVTLNIIIRQIRRKETTRARPRLVKHPHALSTCPSLACAFTREAEPEFAAQ